MPTLEQLDLGSARLPEAARIADMSRRWIELGLPWRYRRERVVGLIRDAETEVVVARDGDRPVGFAAMEFHFDASRAHLILLAVDPGYRRHGTGVALVRWLEKMALLGGIKEILLELRADNEGGLDFYDRLGFRRTDRLRGYYDGRLDAISMRRRIGRSSG